MKNFKSNFNNGFLTILFVAAVVTLSSCSDDEEEIQTPQQQIDLAVASIEDDALATAEFSSITEIVLDESSFVDASGDYEKNSENLPDCVTINYDRPTRTLVIDFGTTGCVGRDGLMRTGTITAVFSRPLRLPGATASVSLNGYSVEGIEIEGTKVITNQTETEGMRSFNVTVTGASITTPDGRNRSWNSDFTVTRTEGAGNLRPYDNVYEVTGSSSGTDRNGNAFSRVINRPLVKDRQIGCLRNFVAGELTVQNSALQSDVVIDFGDGTCDRRATVTYNGRTREVRLR